MTIQTALALCAIGLLSLSSCKKNEDANTITNEITDAEGINTTLTWKTSDNSDPLTNIDLDVYVYPGVGANRSSAEVAWGDESGIFENFKLLPSLPDGDYTITILYFSVSKPGAFTLSFEGVSSKKKYELANLPFTTADDTTEKEVARFNKTGTKFTFTKL